MPRANLSTAEQWAAILGAMHTLTSATSSPLAAAIIAQHANMAHADVERNLKLMARVGLVHHVHWDGERGWLLDSTR